MWRSAEGEGVEQEAELLAGLLLGDAHDLEHSLLDVPLVDTDGAAADLVAVAHDVVGVGQRGTRVLVEGVQELRLRGGECVVHGSPCGVAEGHVTLCAGVGCRLEHRRVNDPGEGPLVVVNESQLLGNLAACRTQQAAGRLGVTGCEEDAVARLRADVIGDTSALIISDVLCNWTGQLAVLAHQDVGQALRAALLGPLLPGVELTAWLAGSTIHDDGTDVLVLEHAEGRVLEELGALSDLDVEAQIRLIGAVEAHRVGVGHARERGLDLVASGGPHLGKDLLGQGDDVLLVDEAHLDVQLRELWLAVGAEVLVPVAAGDLVVPLHAGDHEQLLEQLRGLRQSVEGSWLQACRNQEVTCALWGGTGQRRGLDLREIVALEHLTGRSVGLGAQTECGALGGTAQIQVTVLQTGLFADFAGRGRVVDLERQRGGLVEHLELADVDLDGTGRQVRVLGALRTGLHATAYADTVFAAQRVGALGDLGLAEHDLGHAGTVAQVDEDHATVVSTTAYPAGEGDLRVDVSWAKFAC